MHKKLLKIIDERKNVEDISKLVDITGMLLDKIKEESPGFYNHIERTLYEAIYGQTLTFEKANELVECMKPHGKKWTFEQTSEVLKSHELDLNPVDFYIVMNMAYNDYFDLFQDDLESYIKFSSLFINDPDKKEGKVYLYFVK